MVFILSAIAASAQETGFYPFSFAAGYGITIANGGEQTLTASSAANFGINRHFSEFTTIGLEGQFGKLTGGNALHDAIAKQFTNSYAALSLHADLQLGEVFDYSESSIVNVLRHVSFGTGAGILFNHIDALDTTLKRSTLKFSYKSVNFIVPLRVGYGFKIPNGSSVPRIGVDITYEFNTAYGQGLDGYIDSKTAPIKFYSYISLTLKYGFGKGHIFVPDPNDNQ